MEQGLVQATVFTESREGGDEEGELVREDEGLGHDVELLREPSARGHEPAATTHNT